MKRIVVALFFGLFLFFIATFAHAISSASLVVFPEAPIQGEPIMIAVEGVAVPTDVTDITFGVTPLKVFLYNGRPTAFFGFDLNRKPATTTITVTFEDGTLLTKEVVIGKREKIEAPLGIPQALGGNTPQAATKLVTTLAQENQSLLGLRTGTKTFWKEKFRYPVVNPVVTDAYGYSRKTGAYSIAHKGTDFRAVEGTRVTVMNRGVVRVAKEYRNYGKTIVVDHGLGLQTFYMHLSKIGVNVGELVLPGQVIGRSGKTGYAEFPHLHITVRIGEISIDPMRFLSFFK